MPATSEHLAYEIDTVARIATVVYIGELSDQEVLAFYTQLLADVPAAPGYDFLLDMRYTDWRITPGAISRIDQLFCQHGSDGLRRVAVVRKMLNATSMQQEQVLRAGLTNRTIRYFADMEQAQVWLRSAP